MKGTALNVQFSDEARRIADEMTMHAVAKVHGWCAFRLSDGRPVGHIAYPTRIAAVKAAKWDRDNYLFLEVQPDGMQPKEAQAVLNYARALHSAGFRLPDPGFDYDASMPTFSWDRSKQIRHLASGGRH